MKNMDHLIYGWFILMVFWLRNQGLAINMAWDKETWFFLHDKDKFPCYMERFLKFHRFLLLIYIIYINCALYSHTGSHHLIAVIGTSNSVTLWCSQPIPFSQNSLLCIYKHIDNYKDIIKSTVCTKVVHASEIIWKNACGH